MSGEVRRCDPSSPGRPVTWAAVPEPSSPAADLSGAIDVTVVLPAFNEAGHITTEIDRIRGGLDASHYNGRYELLVVDDGSTDDTAAELAAIADRGNMRVIRFPENRGSGSARRVGTREARGDIVVWTDADMSYPNDRMAELIDELGDYDQIVGARTTEEGTLKALRVPAKWLIRKLAEFLAEREIPDLNSGFRAFRRSVALPYLHLLPTGFSCVTTITMTFLANGHTVRYTPIEYMERAGTSKFHWWADTRRYLLQVVRMVLSYNPLRVFMPVGLLLGLVGGTKLIWDLFDKDLRVPTNTLLLLFLSFQIIAIGLLADLVVRATRKPDDG
ncbi:MAG: glycosyltransferase family 2 protein [Acidimicrobiia bacterium]|nr:glycosyltransferase family 2 protein [Acidimicrobiia bacterium]